MPLIADSVRRQMSRVRPTLTDAQRERDMAAYLLCLLEDSPAVLSRLTSTTAWWIQTDAPRGVSMMMRRRLEKSMEGDFETDSMRYKATMRYIPGITDPRALYGTPGV